MVKPTLAELRTKHPRFIFNTLEFQLQADTLEVAYVFTLEPGITFSPKLSFFHIDIERYNHLDQNLIREWLFRVGMVELLSYWKASCAPEIIIRAGYLRAEELPFWQTLLQNGMSEFFYVNQIDGWQSDFVKFTVDAQLQSYAIDEAVKAERVLIPVGGGKDSVVTVELLKKLSLPLAQLTLNPMPAAKRVMSVASIPTTIEVKRTIDPKLLELNQQGYFNGHTPFSALLAFVSTLCAYLFEYRFVALSNEWSANEENLSFLGHAVNHQYSKSLAFERDFRTYLDNYLSTQVNYFSFLRPLHELQIAQVFAQFPQYFSAFLSCNRGSRQGVWCGVCPKCLFTAIMLSPFLAASQITQIFGKDILNDMSLLSILEELSGVVAVKSLECVGTRAETLAALSLSTRKTEALPALLQYAKEHILKGSENPDEILKSYQFENYLPEIFSSLLLKK